MSVTIRRATKADASRVATLALKLFRQHRDYDPERFAELGNLEGAEYFYGGRAESHDARVFVAEIADQVVGFAYAEYESINYADLLTAALWIHDLYVEESARGTGTGRMLVETAAASAKDLGADKVVIHVAAKNETAQKFFSRFGFRTTMLEMTLAVD
jgi:ribosomal protein S18 acetylase RimI-like enzyme